MSFEEKPRKSILGIGSAKYRTSFLHVSLSSQDEDITFTAHNALRFMAVCGPRVGMHYS